MYRVACICVSIATGRVDMVYLTDYELEEEEGDVDAEEDDHLGGLGDSHDVGGWRAERATKLGGTAAVEVRMARWMTMKIAVVPQQVIDECEICRTMGPFVVMVLSGGAELQAG